MHMALFKQLRAACSAGRLARPRPAIQLARQRPIAFLPVRPFHATTAQDVLESSVDRDTTSTRPFQSLDTFPRRHIGPSVNSVEAMLLQLDPPVASLDDLVKQVIPADILSERELTIGGPGETVNNEGLAEQDMLGWLEQKMDKNIVGRSFIGAGYAASKVPEVIKRNVLENPAWYTSYTPYQPEISQGRLESLLNFQTMVSDLTALPIANASVLDEATAAAEAMTLSLGSLPLSRQKRQGKTFLVSHLCHPQTIAVLQSRAEGFGIKIEVDNMLKNGSDRVEQLGEDLVGVLVQYPNTEGGVEDFKALSSKVHQKGAILSVATDLLALTVLTTPG